MIPACRSPGRVALLMAAAALVACASPGDATVHRRADGALGPYSGSVAAGELLFLSGKIGERGGSFEHEVETALAAVADELARADLALSDLVSVTVYLTDMARYGAFNEVYARVLPEPWPARACVAVAELPGAARVEVCAVARRTAR